MSSKTRPEPVKPRGTNIPLDTEHWGSVNFDVLERLIDGPSTCIFTTDTGETRAGNLYRDTRFGLTIKASGSWHPHQTTESKEYEVPVINGQTSEGILFSLHDAHVDSGRSRSTISGRFGFVGTADHDGANKPPWPKQNPTFDNVSVWIDWLPEFLTNRANPLVSVDLPEVVNDPPSQTVGKVTLTPRVTASQNRFGIEVTETRIDLRASQKHRCEWWFDNWIVPINQLIAMSLGVPAMLTYVATKTNSKPHGDHEHHDWLHITGCGWPTMETQALKPQSPNYEKRRLPKPLLDWRNVNLAKTLPAVRNADNQLDFALESRLNLFYTKLNARHRFLNLTQASEALHSREHGKEKPSDFDLEKFLEGLKEKGVTSKPRKKIKSAFTHPAQLDYSLPERLADLRNIQGLPAPPDLEPEWLNPEEQEKYKTWDEQVTKARNDISHGSKVPGTTWLSRQARYLELLVEIHILIALGIPGRQAVAKATNRHGRRF